MTPLDELRERVLRHAREDEKAQPLPNVTLRYGRRNKTFGAVATPSLCFVLQGNKHVVYGDRSVDYVAPCVSAISLRLPVSGYLSWTNRTIPYLALGIELDQARLAPLVLDTPASDPSTGMIVSKLDDTLIDPLLRLARLFDAPDDASALAPLVEHEILYRMLRGPAGPLLRDFARGVGPTAQIRRAVDWICAHYDEPFSAKQLAGLAGMSVTSLHRHFKALTAMSPLAYHKQIRLQHAREQLVRDAGSISSIAFAIGYESASQFSREYARQFGLPPGADAKRMRSTTKEAPAARQA